MAWMRILAIWRGRSAVTHPNYPDFDGKDLDVKYVLGVIIALSGWLLIGCAGPQIIVEANLQGVKAQAPMTFFGDPTVVVSFDNGQTRTWGIYNLDKKNVTAIALAGIGAGTGLAAGGGAGAVLGGTLGGTLGAYLDHQTTGTLYESEGNQALRTIRQQCRRP